MSLMTMSASRSSVFTFESTVHSSHVLRCLDEQRHRDTFCDVTVVVEGQSFRAHRSVLASCSEYFSHRISTLTQHGVVITLPQEVTAAGFEPLLKFAYTSKLHFGKDNVLEIRNSASVLGFRDLDEACFDFLLPKFFNSNASASFPRKTCCKKKCQRQLSKEDSGIDSNDVLLGDKEVQPVADSPSEREVAQPCNKSVNHEMGSDNNTTPVPERKKSDFIQGPKYRKFIAACGKGSCIMEKTLHNTVIMDVCDMFCSSSRSRNNDIEMEFPRKSTSNSTRPRKGASDDVRKSKKHDKKPEESIEEEQPEAPVVETEGKWDEKEKEAGNEMEHTTGFGSRSNVAPCSVGSSTVLGVRSLYHCPLRALAEGKEITRPQGQEMFGMDIKEGQKTRDAGAVEPVSVHQKAEEQKEAEGKEAEVVLGDRINAGQTGSMTRGAVLVNNAREKSDTEAAENPAESMGYDMSWSQANSHHHDVGRSSDTGSERVQSAPTEWLPNGDLSAGSSRCPFSQDAEQSRCLWKGVGLSECEGASSSLNSGEDGDSETETEGDSESYTRERARQVQLPFSVDWIVDLSRNDFQQLLKQQAFTPEQLDFVHDMRRRSKNRLAAQRCRKRKIDCIYNLQCEIQKLKTEREKLLMEKSQLSQMKLRTCHTVSALCHKVCSEANLQPEQLQVLAKYTSVDCPLASLLPHTDTVPSQPKGSAMAFEETSSTSSRDTVTGDGQYSV